MKALAVFLVIALARTTTLPLPSTSVCSGSSWGSHLRFSAMKWRCSWIRCTSNPSKMCDEEGEDEESDEEGRHHGGVLL
jgi:hypothetical protein